MQSVLEKYLRPIRNSCALCLLLVCFASAVQAEAPASSVEAGEVVTRVRFIGGLLQNLGIELRDVTATSIEAREEHLFAANPGATLSFVAPGGAFRDMVGGTAKHPGGFVLERSGNVLDLRGFSLRPGVSGLTLEMLDAVGRVVLVADHVHSHLDAEGGTLALRHADLEFTAAGAAALGEPRLAGFAIAQFGLDSRFPPFERLVPSGACETPNYTLPRDVALIDLPELQLMWQEGSDIVVAPSAELKNVGQGDVEWCEAFVPEEDCQGIDQHPFLVWGLYRVANGVIEQIGRSDAKHAFYTVNTGCECQVTGSHQVLWVGCEDEYGRFSNDDITYLAPRDEIEAHTGAWEKCNGFFDPDCDASRERPTAEDFADRFLNRMIVDEADLMPPGAQYFVDAWYVVKGDIDIFNTMGWRQVVPSFDSFWTFDFATDFVNGPAIDAWVALERGGEMSASVRVDTGVGHLTVATRVTDGGGPPYRYEYAVHNHDYDAQVAVFEIPIPLGATASAPSFSDADDDAGNDWTVDVAKGSVRFRAPAGNALDWGTLYRFGVTVDSAPVNSRVTLHSGAGGSSAAALPAPTPVLFADDFSSGELGAWALHYPPVEPRKENDE